MTVVAWLARSAVIAALFTPVATWAQVAVGYQQQITAGWTVQDGSSESIRERRTLGVGGFNIQPLGGGDTFSLRTQWELREQGEPFALTITEVNPEIQLVEGTSRNGAAYVMQTSSRYAAPIGLLGTLGANLELMPGETLTVFTDP